MNEVLCEFCRGRMRYEKGKYFCMDEYDKNCANKKENLEGNNFIELCQEIREETIRIGAEAGIDIKFTDGGGELNILMISIVKTIIKYINKRVDKNEN
jgi:hypothetical protein